MKHLINMLLLAVVATGVLSAQTTSTDLDIPAQKAILKGTLLTPNPEKKLPTVIIVPGSGQIKRSDIQGLVSAVFNGLEVAVLIYDKRGVGESTGEYKPVNAKNSKRRIRARAKDVLAIIDVLAKHEMVDEKRIILMGSSQGGWVVPLAASQTDQVASIICISGAANSVGVSDHYDQMADDSESIEDALAALDSYRGVQGFNPYLALTRLEVSGFWIYGGMDKSNPTQADIEVLNKIKEQEGKDFTIKLYENCNHEMMDVRTGQLCNQLIPDLQSHLRQLTDQ